MQGTKATQVSAVFNDFHLLELVCFKKHNSSLVEDDEKNIFQTKHENNAPPAVAGSSHHERALINVCGFFGRVPFPFSSGAAAAAKVQ